MDMAQRIDGIGLAVKRGHALGLGLPGCTDLARAFQGDFEDEAFLTLVDAVWDNLSPAVSGCPPSSPSGSLGLQMSPVGSALSEAGRRYVTHDVTKFVERQTGEFTTKDVDIGCGFGRDEAKARTKALNRLETQGKIARVGGRAGHYRVKCSADEEGMDLENVSQEEFPVVLPFGLNDIVEVFPKEIILIAGETNGGKTSLIFWTLWHTLCSLNLKGILKPKSKYIEELNLHSGYIGLKYLSSEMGPSAIARKVSQLAYHDSDPLPMWNRCIVCEEIGDRPIQDLVSPNGVNCIDYLEVNSEGDFAKMGCAVAEVFKALDGGIAIIATQKRKNSPYGVGGEGMKEKPRLSLTIIDNQDKGYSTLVISKAKHYRDYNPTGMEFDFKVTQRGGKIVPISGKWMRKSEIDQVRKSPNYGRMSY